MEMRVPEDAFDADELLRDLDEQDSDDEEEEEDGPKEIDFDSQDYFKDMVGDVENPEDIWDR